MKKLLFFASDYKIGLSALLCDQLVSIADAGVDYVAIAGDMEQESGLSRMLDEKGVAVKRVNGLDNHAEFCRLVKAVTNIVVDNSVDVIHVQNNWQLAIAAAVKMRLCFRRKVKIAYTLHGFRHNSPVKSRIAQVVIGIALLLAADHVICMTEYLKRKFRMLSYKIRLIPLGVKENFFTHDFVDPRIDKLRLVFPAQFREGKNQDVIIRAFAQYIHTNSDTDARLILPGSGPLLDEMRRLTKNLGIEHQVTFPGQLSKNEVMRAYLDSNIAVVASNSETFGQSIVEPFVLGRCLVTTPVGIAPEIINEGKNGWFFESVPELADILLKLSSDKAMLLRIGKNNHQERSRFKWTTITQQYISEILAD